jgi:hypothetical protein
VLSPSSILPTPSSHCASISARKNIWCAFKKNIVLLFKNFVTLKLHYLKLRKLGSVCIRIFTQYYGHVMPYRLVDR